MAAPASARAQGRGGQPGGARQREQEAEMWGRRPGTDPVAIEKAPTELGAGDEGEGKSRVARPGRIMAVVAEAAATGDSRERVEFKNQLVHYGSSVVPVHVACAPAPLSSVCSC